MGQYGLDIGMRMKGACENKIDCRPGGLLREVDEGGRKRRCDMSRDTNGACFQHENHTNEENTNMLASHG